MAGAAGEWKRQGSYKCHQVKEDRSRGDSAPDLGEPIDTPQIRNQGVICSAEGKAGGNADGVKAHRSLEEQVRWEYLILPPESSKIKALLINSTENVTYIPTVISAHLPILIHSQTGI